MRDGEGKRGIRKETEGKREKCKKEGNKTGRKRDNERGRNQKRWRGNEEEIVREIVKGK